MNVSGGQCVMTSGGPMMLKWYADSLVSLLMVSFIVNAVSVAATFNELNLSPLVATANL